MSIVKKKVTISHTKFVFAGGTNGKETYENASYS